MKLIDPDELERVLRPILTDESCPLHIAAEIDMNLDLMPKVDAVPVRHGRWIRNKNGTYSCSECQSWIPNEQKYYANFCLYCGARMDGDQ